MIRVIKYPKIQLHNQEVFYPVILEKIDGSNVSIGFVDHRLILQSRNKILDRFNLKFCGLEHIIDRLIEKVTQLKGALSDVKNFLVYGELFGHHRNIRYRDELSARVYKNDKIFYRVFDLAILDDGVKKFMDYDRLVAILKEVSMPYLEPLDVRLEDLSDLVETRKSGLSGDRLEGFVVKDRKDQNFYNRKIFKVKRIEFKEVVVDIPSKKKNRPNLQNYLTKARLKSAHSKLENYDESECCLEMARDIFAEVDKTIPLDTICRAVCPYVKEHLRDIADDEQGLIN